MIKFSPYKRLIGLKWFLKFFSTIQYCVLGSTTMSGQTLPLNISNLKEIFIYYIYLEHKYFCKFDKYDSKDETQRPIIFYTNHETETNGINQSINFYIWHSLLGHLVLYLWRGHSEQLVLQWTNRFDWKVETESIRPDKPSSYNVV